MFLFSILVILWIFRDPKFVPGWGALFIAKFVGDETTAIAMALIVMTFPKRLPISSLKQFLPIQIQQLFKQTETTTNSSESSNELYAPLVSWKTVQRKLMWDILILLGGGFAMAKGVETSGLSQLLSSQLKALSNIPSWAFVTMSITTMTLLTEISGNAATTTILLPLMQSIDFDVNPIMLMFPVTIASSFAFMLPVATPPNAIVFGIGIVTVKDMVKAGFVLNVICIVLASLYMNTYVTFLFHLSTVPSWASNQTNVIVNYYNST